MTAVDFPERRFLEPEPSLASSIGLLALGLVPSLLWAAVGIPLVVWNFTDPGQRSFISVISAGLLLVVVAANLAPFIAAGVALGRARTSRGLAWPRAFRSAAAWTGVMCGVSFVVTAWATGGMP